jgi:hypothetical protein
MNRRFTSLVGGILLSTVLFIPAHASQNASPPADNTKMNKVPGATADGAKNNLSTARLCVKYDGM